jgi:hypothetical protein
MTKVKILLDDLNRSRGLRASPDVQAHDVGRFQESLGRSVGA